MKENVSMFNTKAVKEGNHFFDAETSLKRKVASWDCVKGIGYELGGQDRRQN